MPDLKAIFLDSKLSLTFGVERRTWSKALSFVLLFSIFEFVHTGDGSLQHLSRLYQQGDAADLILGIIYAVLSIYLLFLFVLSMLASPWRYRWIYILIFAVITFAEYGYAKALGRLTNFYDIVSAVSATDQQRLDSISSYIDLAALIPCLALIFLCVWSRTRRPRFGASRLLALIVSIALFHVHFYYANQIFFDGRFVSNSFGAFFQSTADFVLVDPLAAINARMRRIVEQPDAVHGRVPDNNIIFVFDESVRGDHLSLNGYDRPTTPYLESLARDGIIRNWGIAVSASTISHPSYNAMITGATPDMLDSLSYGDINSMPTLFQYAKAMDYTTYLIDGQMKTYWGGNDDDLNYIDNYVSMKQLAGADHFEDWELGDKITNDDVRNNALKQWEIDRKIAGMVNGIFSGSKGNFVFIYKRGVHYPYEKNYPQTDEFWRPVYHFREQYEVPPADQVQAVINSYDNAIRYNLDDFFKRLSSDYVSLPNNTVIIYTSDHGESFFMNGKAGHGGVTREEAMVPLFAIGLRDLTVDTTFAASHANVFSALLDLMGYPLEMRKFAYQTSLFDGKGNTPAHRFYNPPGSKKIAFD
jgi:glucan phosphoethanolaminetransferase (alkaline phosphatase superfamily)